MAYVRVCHDSLSSVCVSRECSEEAEEKNEVGRSLFGREPSEVRAAAVECIGSCSEDASVDEMGGSVGSVTKTGVESGDSLF